MANRREFSKAVQVAIRKRATINGVRYCEWCKAQAMRGEVHHLKQDAMEVDKSRKLKAEDGAYLCIPCHRTETEKQQGELKKVLRVEARDLGAHRPHVQPIKSRNTLKYRKRKHEERQPLPPRRLFTSCKSTYVKTSASRSVRARSSSAGK